MLYQMQKTLGLYLHTCSRVLKNREGTITLFHLSIQKLKVPSISNVQWWLLRQQAGAEHPAQDAPNPKEGLRQDIQITDQKEDEECLQNEKKENCKHEITQNMHWSTWGNAKKYAFSVEKPNNQKALCAVD